MKKMVICLFGLCSYAAQAHELSSFSDISAAVLSGKHVKFVIDVNECKSPLLKKYRPKISITPNAIMILESRITASDRHFTMDDPSAPGKPTYGYSKFNINDDGTATTKITVMNAINYESIASYQIDCQLGNGFKVFD